MFDFLGPPAKSDRESFFELPLEQREDQTRLLILELSIMSEADYVICTMSSNVCRLLQSLRSARDPNSLIGIDARDGKTGLENFWCFVARFFLSTEKEIEYCMDIDREWFPF